MVKQIIAILCIAWAVVLTGCSPMVQGGYNVQNGPVPSVNQPWNCNPPKQRYRSKGPIKAYCHFTDRNGLEQYACLTEEDYDKCRRRRHCRY